MYDRVISSGDSGLVHLSPTTQIDFRCRTMDVASVCVVYVSPGGEYSASRIGCDAHAWNATVHPETRASLEVLSSVAEVPGATTDDPCLARDPSSGVGVEVLVMCVVDGPAKAKVSNTGHRRRTVRFSV